jgi:hypothetical protein
MLQALMRLTSSSMLLCLEAQRVVLLRMGAIGAGGAYAQVEINRMILEKVFTAMTVAGMMSFGRSPQSVIRHYRLRVRK